MRSHAKKRGRSGRTESPSVARWRQEVAFASRCILVGAALASIAACAVSAPATKRPAHPPTATKKVAHPRAQNAESLRRKAVGSLRAPDDQDGDGILDSV